MTELGKVYSRHDDDSDSILQFMNENVKLDSLAM